MVFLLWLIRLTAVRINVHSKRNDTLTRHTAATLDGSQARASQSA